MLLQRFLIQLSIYTTLIHLKQFCSERGGSLKSGSMEIIIRKGRLGEGVGSYVAVAEPRCHLAEPQIVACDSS